MIIPSLLFLCFITEIVPLRITEFTVPHAVQAGSDVEITCDYALDSDKKSNVFLKWWWTDVDDEDDDNDGVKRQIFQKPGDSQGKIIKQQYNISIVDDDTLLLSNLEPQHSGTYECEVFANLNEDRKRATMTVFTQGSGPDIDVIDLDDDDDDDDDDSDDDDDDDDTFLVQCNATGVSPKPELVIKMNDVLLNDSQTIYGPKGGVYNITSSYKIIAKELAEETKFTCELFYEDQSVSHPPYADTYIYTSGGVETTTEELTTTTDDPDDSDDNDDDDQPGDNGTRLDNSILLLSLMVAFTLTNKWLNM